MSPVRRPRGWARGTLACAGLLACCLLPASPASADPGPDPARIPLSTLLTQLQTLYLKAERATEAYNGTKEKLDRQRAQVAALDKQLADQRSAVTEGLNRAGALARQQYQGGGISPYVRLLLSHDPTEALSQAHILREAAGSQASLVNRLQAGEQRLARLNAQAKSALAAVDRLAREQQRQRDDVKNRLHDVEKAIASLTGAQLAELARLEQQGTDQAQRAFLASGKLGNGNRLPSEGGAKAIAYVFAKLGKPYLWGAAGPDAFDCSGLTSQAWARAGHPIPRTSQGQWAQLPHVPLDQLRPGDLVVYFADATHVALYVGNGMVVQAPRTGEVVKVSPIAANPVLGAVRPDGSSPSVARYRLPDLPAGGGGTG